ncbi:hypothetical protein LP420_36095 [Massilia sp. B-10]|nr:hypothetical protein LP420_36095 [Massilia sp. B-10]
MLTVSLQQRGPHQVQAAQDWFAVAREHQFEHRAGCPAEAARHLAIGQARHRLAVDRNHAVAATHAAALGSSPFSTSERTRIAPASAATSRPMPTYWPLFSRSSASRSSWSRYSEWGRAT